MFAQRDLWLRRLTQTLAARQIPLDPPDILMRLEQMLASLQFAFGTYLESGPAAGLLLHLLFCCLSQQDALHVKMEAREHVEQRYPRELALCTRAIRLVNQHSAFPLPEDEAYNLLGILKQVDIFINIGELSLERGRT